MEGLLLGEGETRYRGMGNERKGGDLRQRSLKEKMGRIFLCFKNTVELENKRMLISMFQEGRENRTTFGLSNAYLGNCKIKAYYKRVFSRQ